MSAATTRPKNCISETAHVLGFSYTTVSSVYTEWCECAMLRMARLIQVGRMVTFTQITTLYNLGEKKIISECRIHGLLEQMGN
ncbi:hypothetical protein AMELA_G00195380, partial [Ameiurus melas]